MENYSLKDSNRFTRNYLDSLLIESRYLDSVVPDIGTTIFGKRFSSPVMIAAFSHLGKHHDGGMIEMARGAAVADVCNWAGMGSKEELEGICKTGAGTIKIIKPYKARNRVVDMIRFAEEQGCIAVGIDIDHSFRHDGQYDIVLGEEMMPIKLEELKEFVCETKLPFVIKGILSVSDAVKCADAGVKGIEISHHSGILPYAVPPLMALPEIKRAIGDSIEIFVDCGIANGYDVFKCLALGAKAANVGRAILPSFKDKGAEGIKEYIDSMNNELRGIMAKTGSKDTNHIANGVIWETIRGYRI